MALRLVGPRENTLRKLKSHFLRRFRYRMAQQDASLEAYILMGTPDFLVAASGFASIFVTPC